MVTPSEVCCVLAQAEPQTVLEQLDPERRVAVVMALVGLGLLAALLVAIVMLGGRWARQTRPRRQTLASGLSRQTQRRGSPSHAGLTAETLGGLMPDEDTRC